MHSRWVLDTSVVIKWFRQSEVLADRALAIRAAYLDGRALVFVPTLLAYELINVLRYKPDLATDQVAQAATSVLEMGLDWVMPAVPWLRRAAVIARDYDVTVYDAAFTALAESLDATLITADAQLAARMSAPARVRFLGDWGEFAVNRTPETRDSLAADIWRACDMQRRDNNCGGVMECVEHMAWPKGQKLRPDREAYRV